MQNFIEMTQHVENGLELIASVIKQVRGDESDLTDRSSADPFINEVFEMRAYFWGECDCLYSERELLWEAENPEHATGCYQLDIEDAWELGIADQLRAEILEAACAKHGLSYPQGAMIHCTCGYQEKFRKFQASNKHGEDCLVDKPNFLHKATGFECYWCKHSRRGGCQNQEIAPRSLAELIHECICSVW